MQMERLRISRELRQDSRHDRDIREQDTRKLHYQVDDRVRPRPRSRSPDLQRGVRILSHDQHKARGRYDTDHRPNGFQDSRKTFHSHVDTEFSSALVVSHESMNSAKNLLRSSKDDLLSKDGRDRDKMQHFTHIGSKQLTEETVDVAKRHGSLCQVCSFRTRHLKHHILYSHLPVCLQETKIDPNDEMLHDRRAAALKLLAQWILGRGQKLTGLVDLINSEGSIPEGCQIVQSFYPLVMEKFCESQGWRVPAKFELNPINSPAVLLHWRVLLALLGHLTEEQQKLFKVMEISDEQAKLQSVIVNGGDKPLSITKRTLRQNGPNPKQQSEFCDLPFTDERTIGPVSFDVNHLPYEVRLEMVPPAALVREPNNACDVCRSNIDHDVVLQLAPKRNVCHFVSHNDLHAALMKEPYYIEDHQIHQSNTGPVSVLQSAPKMNVPQFELHNDLHATPIREPYYAKDCQKAISPDTILQSALKKQVQYIDGSMPHVGPGNTHDAASIQPPLYFDTHNGAKMRHIPAPTWQPVYVEDQQQCVDSSVGRAPVFIHQSQNSARPCRREYGGPLLNTIDRFSDDANDASPIQQPLYFEDRQSYSGAEHIPPRRQRSHVEDQQQYMDSARSVRVETPVPLLNAIDSFYHLDKTAKELWGTHLNSTMEKLLMLGPKPAPGYAVNLIGGVQVYSDPDTYPQEIEPSLQWKVALGVHPMKEHLLSDQKLGQFVRLFATGHIAALGVIGLDRSAASNIWTQQENTFFEMLRFAKTTMPIILHVRGNDAYSSDVQARCLQILQQCRPSDQPLHLHCFRGTQEHMKLWLKAFPNTYFGFTAKCLDFDEKQLEALRSVPLDRILLETNSPRKWPALDLKITTPVMIGSVAMIVATQGNYVCEDLLEATTANASSLYSI